MWTPLNKTVWLYSLKICTWSSSWCFQAKWQHSQTSIHSIRSCSEVTGYCGRVCPALVHSGKHVNLLKATILWFRWKVVRCVITRRYLLLSNTIHLLFFWGNQILSVSHFNDLIEWILYIKGASKKKQNFKGTLVFSVYSFSKHFFVKCVIHKGMT